MTARDRLSTFQWGLLTSPDGFLWLAFAVCASVGAWARLHDLGASSLAVDEYYLVQSVRNILRVGVPEYACGGYYMRGLLHQYLSAGLTWLHVSPEVAIRIPSVVGSALTVAGGWLLARHVSGRRAAIIVSILLSISLWQIEFARFGRMYALFQACTVFYAFATLRFVEQGRDSDLRWMIILAALAVLSHEGGVLLCAFTLIAVLIRPTAPSAKHVVVAVLALVAGLAFQLADFRFLGVGNPYSAELLISATDPDQGQGPIDHPRLLPMPLPVRVVLLVAAVLAALFICRRSVSRGGDMSAHRVALLACTWLAVFGALALQLWLLAILIAVCALTVGIIEPSLASRRDVLVPAMSLALAFIGAGTLLAIVSAYSGPDVAAAGHVAARQLKWNLRYPDLYIKVWVQWGKVLPALGTCILAVSLAALAIMLRSKQVPAPAWRLRYRWLFAVTLSLLIAATLADQPYQATRYTFFLYPLFLTLLVSGSIIVCQVLATRTAAQVFVWTVVLGCFVTGNEVHVRHLLRISSPEFLYRLGYDRSLQEHFYRRWDYRGMGSALNERASERDLVITTAYPVMPYYSGLFDFVYLDRSNRRIWVVSGCGGKRDLWSNLPIVTSPDKLRSAIETSTVPVWLVVTTEKDPARMPIEAELLHRFAGNEVFRSIDGHLALLRIP